MIRWGIAKDKITELNWWNEAEFQGLTVALTPAKHFSGRGIFNRDELFTSFSELLEKSKVEEPTLIELTAIGSILHSFYNGIENIFKTIGKNIDDKIPSGNHWHSQLINK